MKRVTIKLLQFNNKKREKDISNMFSKEVGMNIICAIPCYCDIQFNTEEFLTVLKYPDHPFAKRLEALAKDKHINMG